VYFKPDEVAYVSGAMGSFRIFSNINCVCRSHSSVVFLGGGNRSILDTVCLVSWCLVFTGQYRQMFIVSFCWLKSSFTGFMFSRHQVSLQLNVVQLFKSCSTFIASCVLLLSLCTSAFRCALLYVAMERGGKKLWRTGTRQHEQTGVRQSSR